MTLNRGDQSTKGSKSPICDGGRLGVGLHLTTNFFPFCIYTPFGSLLEP